MSKRRSDLNTPLHTWTNDGRQVAQEDGEQIEQVPTQCDRVSQGHTTPMVLTYELLVIEIRILSLILHHSQCTVSYRQVCEACSLGGDLRGRILCLAAVLDR
jgi:hypothetical protein